MRTLSHILNCLFVTGAFASQPALTIYNQNFAVVRDTVPLDLKAGVTEVRYAEATAHVEPDSVILRDPAGRRQLQVLEQNYRNDPVSQELLMSLFEGKTIDFENLRTVNNSQVRERVPGKIIRSGYVPHYAAMNRYGQQYYQTQMAYAQGSEQPVIEMNGRIQFGLPGQPIFPNLGDDTVLKPTLNWLIQSDRPGKLDAEISYVTGGFTWEADYNLVAPEKGDLVDLIGWVTMDNQSGKTFRDAKIKLMAGDVNKIQPQFIRRQLGGFGGGGAGGIGGPPVTEKSFDEYHLYTVARSTTLLDRETKQVEFVRAAGVKAAIVYVYDGVESECRFTGGLNDDRNYGTRCNKKVWVMREFMNAETNHLGLPLPKGRLRFYRRNDDGQMEFTGEDMIDHTPRDEKVRVTTGNAFDLVGERKQTDFKIYLWNPPSGMIAPGAVVDPTTGRMITPQARTTTVQIVDPTTGQVITFQPPTPPGTNLLVDPLTGQPLPQTATSTATNTIPSPPWIDESFEINVRNHKKEPAEIRVVEHLYRWSNWEVTQKSDPFTRTDAQTMEFRVALKPDEEKVVTYTVHYWW